MPAAPKPSAVIFAKNITRVARFYETVVPLSEVYADQVHIVLDGPSMQLVLHAIPKDTSDKLIIQVPPAVREDTPIKLCLPVASLAEARDRAAPMGGALYSTEYEWQARGFRACDGYDPEGNVVQFRESAP